MEKILAAVDSSETAKLVCARAIELARATGAKLRLVRAVPIHPFAMAPGTFGAPLTVQPSALIEEAETALDRALSEVPVALRDGIVVEVGAPADVVCKVARDYDPDIVVLGAHRYGAFERVLGTTAARLVNRLDRPAYVVRPTGRRTSKTDASVSLRHEHAFLETTYAALLDAYRHGEWSDVREHWDVFERVLRAHMDIEEKRIIPAYREIDPREAEALVAEHDELRGLLGTLSVGVDLHLASHDIVAELIGRLRAHAAREELLFYPWIDWELGPEDVVSKSPASAREGTGLAGQVVVATSQDGRSPTPASGISK